MQIKQLFQAYEEYLRFYRKKGTLEAYLKDFKLLKKALDDLLIFDTSQFTDDTYNQMIRWIKRTTSKKNSKVNDTMSSFLTILNFSKIDYNFKIIKLIDDTM